MLSADNIAAASQTIDPMFLNTPQYVDPGLSERVGRPFAVKVETLNPIRSFKGRGCDHFLRDLPAGTRVVAASAGNFGQGVAYAARSRDVDVQVFASVHANAGKVAAMRALGATVTQVGEDLDAAKDAARAHAASSEGAVFVEDGDDPLIAEGAGTIAVELAALGVDTVLVPVGNGALVSGIGCWLKAHSPATSVIGVCPAGAPAMQRSWRSGVPTSTKAVATAADALAVRVPVPAAVEWMRALVDDVLLVTEEQISEALRVIRDTVGLLLEPGAVVGVAAALHHDLPGSSLATILTGGNLSADLRRELVGD